MLENPLKKVLVKKADLFDTLRGTMSDEERAAYNQKINQRRAEAEQREALIDKYLPSILDPSQPIPDEIKPILQEAIGNREIDDYKAWNKGFRGWRFGKNGKLIDAYGKRMSAKFDLLGKLKVPTKELTPSVTQANPSTPAPAAPAAPTATPTQNPFNTINLADFNKPYSLDDARAIVSQGVDGKPVTPAAIGVTNTTASAATPTAAPVQQEVPESAGEATSQSKSTDVKNPLISIEQARELLAKGITPTSVGGYAQILGADGTNARAQQELELMDKDPTYNPFANTQAKYVQKLNRMRLLDQYNPETIMAENQRIQQNQAKLDADRRSRMEAAKYYAGQGVQGASDYHNYMTRGGKLSQAGQQWRDNFDVAGWNQQQSQAQSQQANKTKFRAQQPVTNPVQAQAPLGVEPRPVAEQAAMSKALGNADTGVGAGSHAAANAYNAASNKTNGLSGATSGGKFPVSVAPPNNGTAHTSTTSAGTQIYTKSPSTRTKTAFVKNPFLG